MASIWLIGPGGRALAAELEAAGHNLEVHAVEDIISVAPHATPDVAFVRPNGEPAMILARRLALHAPDTAWVMVLDAAAVDQAPASLHAGAADVCIEPMAPGAAGVLVSRLLRDQQRHAQLGYLKNRVGKDARLEEIAGESPPMRELVEQVQRLSHRSAFGPPLSVLLTGETGTGKGLVARVLHFTGRRRDGPFIEVNCAAIPATLIEAELFGYERGAFTDARSSHAGLWETAHGGTLFLDEVSCLSLESQAKVLTVLEGRRVRRLGSSVERPVDVQIVAASSQDLSKLAAQGGFRPELLHRLALIWFKLPPLRERGDDAPLLAERFLAQLAAEYRLPAKQLSAPAREAIRRHAWPGNVRELRHAMERAMLTREGEKVEPADLSLETHAGPASVTATPAGGIEVSLPPGGAALSDFERAIIESALQLSRGNVSQAAVLLRLTRDTLRSRIEKLRINAAAFSR